MSRPRRTAAMFAALCFVLVACGNDDDTDASADDAIGSPAPEDDGAEAQRADFPVTIENCDVEVTFEQPPERVFLMFHGAIEMALSLGVRDEIIGSAYLDNALADGLPAVDDFGPYYEGVPSREQFLAAEPDFVYGSFQSAFTDERFGTRDALADLGIGTLLLEQQACPGTPEPGSITFEHLYADIANAGTVFGRSDAADALIADARATVAAVETAVGDVADRPSVAALSIYQSGPTISGRGGSTIFDEIIRAAGGTNVFGDVPERYFEPSVEQVVAADPDVLIFYTCCGSELTKADAEPALEQFRDNPAFAGLQALADDRVLILDFAEMDLSVRNPDTLETVARFLHPDRFDD